MAPLRIEVSGESTIYLPAERAIVHLTVESEGDSQEKVSQDVATASAQIRDLLKGLAGKDSSGEALPDAPITHWSTSSLSTGSHWTYGDDGNKKNRVYTARKSFEAKFQDFGKLGSVATSLSKTEHVAIDRIEWKLTDETTTKYKTESRVRAVRDAVAKAKDFALALDKPVPPVSVITDSRDSYSNTTYRAEARMMRSMAPAEEGLNFSPEDIPLNCSVSIVCEEK